MKVVLYATFDCGLSIGFDDAPFKGWQRAVFGDLPTPIPPSAEERFGITDPVGSGLTFPILEWPPVRIWHDEAAIVAASEEYLRYMGVEKRKAQLVSQAVRRFPPSDCRIELFSCGVALLILEIDELPDSLDPEVLNRASQTYEYAAYGKFGSSLQLQYSLRERLTQLLTSLARTSELAKVTAREPLSVNGQAIDSIAGFNILFFTENKRALSSLRKFRESSKGGNDNFHHFSFEETDIHLTWYISLIHPNAAVPPISWSRVLRAFLLYSLFHAVCDACEQTLKSRLTEFTSGITSISTADLIKLRALILCYVTSTDYLRVTQNMEMISLFQQLDDVGSLSQRRESIRHSSEILHVLQNAKEQEEAEQRQHRVNLFITVITSLTFISVLADLLNIDTTVRDLVPSILSRGIIYGLVMAAFISAVALLHRRH